MEDLCAEHVSAAVISKPLDIRPEDFTKVETTVDGLTVGNAPCPEDLSRSCSIEELGLAVGES